MFGGSDIFVVIVVFLAVLTVFLGVKTVPQGYNWTRRTIRPLHENVEAGPQSSRSLHIGRKMNVMEQVIDVPKQEVITKDNASVAVDGIAFFQVSTPPRQAIEFLAAVRNHVCVITRLRLDANLFHFPPSLRKGRGRRPIKGKPHKKLSAVLKDRKVVWKRYRVSLWYGRTNRIVEITSGTALWYRGGVPPVPIRWLLVRDPSGELDPQAFLATDLNAHPHDILAWFVSRWQVEVTFAEVRAHLGVETQRQWSDNAILRTTPALLALFSIVTLWTHDLAKSQNLKPRTAAWYSKSVLTFSDAIAAVRREIWAHQISFMSRPRRDRIEIPIHIWRRMENALAYAA